MLQHCGQVVGFGPRQEVAGHHKTTLGWVSFRAFLGKITSNDWCTANLPYMYGKDTFKNPYIDFQPCAQNAQMESQPNYKCVLWWTCICITMMCECQSFIKTAAQRQTESEECKVTSLIKRSQVWSKGHRFDQKVTGLIKRSQVWSKSVQTCMHSDMNLVISMTATYFWLDFEECSLAWDKWSSICYNKAWLYLAFFVDFKLIWKITLGKKYFSKEIIRLDSRNEILNKS